MGNLLNYKDIEIKDRKWRVKKFNAFTGSYMLFKVIGIITPLLKGLNMTDIAKVKEGMEVNLPKEINFTEMLSGLTTLSEDDFIDIQTKCLQVSYEVLPSGEATVLNKDGNFGVIDIETDTSTVLALTVHALLFNVAGFFGENPLEGLMGMISLSTK